METALYACRGGLIYNVADVLQQIWVFDNLKQHFTYRYLSCWQFHKNMALNYNTNGNISLCVEAYGFKKMRLTIMINYSVVSV